jgi:hypothetical protein
MIFIVVGLNLGLFLETTRKEIFDDIGNSQVHDGRLKFSKKDFHHASRPGGIKGSTARLDKKNSHTGLHYKSTQLLHELKIQGPQSIGWTQGLDRAGVEAERS